MQGRVEDRAARVMRERDGKRAAEVRDQYFTAGC